MTLGTLFFDIEKKKTNLKQDFETENLLTDLMTIYNGKNTNGSIIASFGGNLEAMPQELFPVLPWGNYIASTDPSGCITIKFDKLLLNK